MQQLNEVRKLLSSDLLVIIEVETLDKDLFVFLVEFGPPKFLHQRVEVLDFELAVSCEQVFLCLALEIE